MNLDELVETLRDFDDRHITAAQPGPWAKAADAVEKLRMDVATLREAIRAFEAFDTDPHATEADGAAVRRDMAAALAATAP